jgi:hypothetical protein
MRALIFAAGLVAALLAGQPASAAPTCQDRTGGAIKCGVPGAMPVGWTPPPGQRFEHDMRESADLSATEQWALVSLLVGLFGLIALMPRFDGASGADWDQQEEDEDG